MLGPRRPARPPGCAIDIIPGTPAPPFVDLASIRTKCVGRADCLDDLRFQTCAAGGDMVHGLSESMDQHITTISATVALRGQSGSSTSIPWNRSADADGCSPICSPGFDCRGGRCVPLCNPACGPAEICNVHRTCEPVRASAQPAAPP